MSTPPVTTKSVLLHRLATRIFGDDWTGPLSLWIGVNLRTLKRIRLAALDNQEHLSAEGALRALSEAIGEIDKAIEAAKKFRNGS